MLRTSRNDANASGKCSWVVFSRAYLVRGTAFQLPLTFPGYRTYDSKKIHGSPPLVWVLVLESHF